jgi:hypothetical protein
MGPGTPWVEELARFGVDYLAGVEIPDHVALRQTVAEGGGVRLFEGPVGYRLADLRTVRKMPASPDPHPCLSSLPSHL